jgi:hypothetical protein
VKGNDVHQGNLFEVPVEPNEVLQVNIHKRKLQVCNGYHLDLGQLSRLMGAIREADDGGKISRTRLVEATGFPDRYVEALVSMGAAMGLIKTGAQLLTEFGKLVARYDLFFQRRGTLEWCHFAGAGSYRNLVWFDIFNKYIKDRGEHGAKGFITQFRKDYTGQYSDRTMRKVFREEVHFITEAYLDGGFAPLKLFEKRQGDLFTLQRHFGVEPLILCAMLYRFREYTGAGIFSLEELNSLPGSPAVVFGIDDKALRQLVEGLHARGFLAYETTHDLDQMRFKPGYGYLDFLEAYFKQHEPRPSGLSKETYHA